MSRIQLRHKTALLLDIRRKTSLLINTGLLEPNTLFPVPKGWGILT